MTTTDQNDALPLQNAAFLLLIDRALAATRDAGFAGCAMLTTSIERELTNDDPAAAHLRISAPFLAEIEREAVAMLALRCQACRLTACPKHLAITPPE